MPRLCRGLLLVVVASAAASEMAAGQQRPLSCEAGALRREIEELNRQMTDLSRTKREEVAGFYLDGATILYGGGRVQGREQIRRYWSEGPTWTEWTLEVHEAGGGCEAPWIRGRSTLTSESGRRMVTDFLAVLKRDQDGRLRYYLDVYVPARQ